MFLEVQILGSGLIPRIGGLAPKYSLTKAPPSLIRTIMSTPGLSLKYKNPETGELAPLTRDNIQAILDKYGNWNGKKVTTVQDNTVPNTVKAKNKNDVDTVIDVLTKQSRVPIQEVAEAPVNVNKVDIPDVDVPLGNATVKSTTPIVNEIKNEPVTTTTKIDDIIVDKQTDEIKIEEEVIVDKKEDNNIIKPKYNNKKKN